VARDCKTSRRLLLRLLFRCSVLLLGMAGRIVAAASARNISLLRSLPVATAVSAIKWRFGRRANNYHK
jgi:hypothetical protein